MSDLNSEEHLSAAETRLQRATRSSVTIIEHPLELNEHPLELHLYHIPEAQLDLIAESGLGRSLNFGLACSLLGACVSLLAIWLTVELNSVKAAATLSSMVVTVHVLFVFFSVRAFGDYRRSKRELKRVKGN